MVLKNLTVFLANRLFTATLCLGSQYSSITAQNKIVVTMDSSVISKLFFLELL